MVPVLRCGASPSYVAFRQSVLGARRAYATQAQMPKPEPRKGAGVQPVRRPGVRGNKAAYEAKQRPAQAQSQAQPSEEEQLKQLDMMERYQELYPSVDVYSQHVPTFGAYSRGRVRVRRRVRA
jgi:hypothetical protein